MATRGQLLKAAAAVGATVDFGVYGFNVDTPRGFVWRSNGCSTVAVQYRNNGGQSWKPKAYDEALGLMAMGVDEAPDANDPDAGYWWSEED